MLPGYVRERTFLVATPMGSWTTQARTPRTAVRDWAASTDITPGKMTKEVAENYWICSLIDDGKEF